MRVTNIFKRLGVVFLLFTTSCTNLFNLFQHDDANTPCDNCSEEEDNPVVLATTITYYNYPYDDEADATVTKDHKYIYLLEAPETSDSSMVFVGWENRAEERLYRPGARFYYDQDVSLYGYWVDKCSQCEGSGETKTYKSCSECNGVGYTTTTSVTQCANCHGSGQVKDERMCNTCHGAGKLDIFRCNYGHTYYAQYFGDYVTLCPTCANLGRTSIMTTSGKRKCGDCNDGYVDYGMKTCGSCNGNGSVSKDIKHNCEHCNATGQVLDQTYACSLCHGSRMKIYEEEAIAWVNSIRVVLEDNSLHLSFTSFTAPYIAYRAALSESKEVNPYFDLTYRKGTEGVWAEVEDGFIVSEEIFFYDLVSGKDYYLYFYYIGGEGEKMSEIVGPYRFTPGVGYSTTIAN